MSTVPALIFSQRRQVAPTLSGSECLGRSGTAQHRFRDPLLDVEIVNANHCIARVRPVDLKLGKRLEIQLKLAQQMACLLAPRFCGQNIKLQLHDEDPGVDCLRMDAPVGANVESSPLIPDPYCLGTNGYEGLRVQLQIDPFLSGVIDSL